MIMSEISWYVEISKKKLAVINIYYDDDDQLLWLARVRRDTLTYVTRRCRCVFGKQSIRRFLRNVFLGDLKKAQ